MKKRCILDGLHVVVKVYMRFDEVRVGLYRNAEIGEGMCAGRKDD